MRVNWVMNFKIELKLQGMLSEIDLKLLNTTGRRKSKFQKMKKMRTRKKARKKILQKSQTFQKAITTSSQIVLFLLKTRKTKFRRRRM